MQTVLSILVLYGIYLHIVFYYKKKDIISIMNHVACKHFECLEIGKTEARNSLVALTSVFQYAHNYRLLESRLREYNTLIILGISLYTLNTIILLITFL